MESDDTLEHIKELDLHGKRFKAALQYFFREYEAARVGSRTLKLNVIHGVGSKRNSGVIRTELRKLLSRHTDKLIYELGEDVDGNQGRTLVWPRRNSSGEMPAPLALKTVGNEYVEVLPEIRHVEPPTRPSKGLVSERKPRQRGVHQLPQKNQVLCGQVVEDDGKYLARLMPSGCLAHITNMSDIPAKVQSGESNGMFFVLEANKVGARVRFEMSADASRSGGSPKRKRSKPDIPVDVADPLETDVLAFCSTPRRESKLWQRFRKWDIGNVQAAVKRLRDQGKLDVVASKTKGEKILRALAPTGAQ